MVHHSHLPASVAWTSRLAIHLFTHSVIQYFWSTHPLRNPVNTVLLLVMLICTLVNLTSLSFHLACLPTALKLLREETFLARERHTGLGTAARESLFSSGNTEPAHLGSEAPGGRDGDSWSRREDSRG